MNSEPLFHEFLRLTKMKFLEKSNKKLGRTIRFRICSA